MPTPLASMLAEDMGMPIVVHSHLRWDFVWQRPQQLLSRFSERHRVLFIEEPAFLDDTHAARLDISRPLPHVYRAVPMLPAALRGRYDTSSAIVRDLVLNQMATGGSLGGVFERPIHWFYTPMPAPAMIGAFGERAVVYDCMDELSQFRFAPASLVDRERLLLARADVVFTGGHRLLQSKKELHDNVHFFGCGVDVAHFGAARSADLAPAELIASLSRPVMGYYGVIDERIDYDLLARLSAAFPEASLAMVGPVVKVDPSELPQGRNIHWLGQRPYSELPAYVKGFDVCLMPFALNDATEYINPTKTLEYMAAGKPIVSTAISDVKHHFAQVVDVAESRDDFIDAVRCAILAPDADRITRGLDEARDNTWDRVVARMSRILADAVRLREARTSGAVWSDESVAPQAVGARGVRPSRSALLSAAEASGD